MLSYLRTGLVWLWVSILVIVVDRLTKMWVVDHLIAYEPLQIFSFLNLTLAYNTGAAFNFLNGATGWQNSLFTSLALVVSGAIVWWLAKLPARERWQCIALSLIMGGALGNAWDRQSYGHVIDFLDFHWLNWHFAVFNVADSGICVGAFMLVLHWYWKR